MGFHDELRKTLSLVGNLVEILGALVFLRRLARWKLGATSRWENVERRLFEG